MKKAIWFIYLFIYFKYWPWSSLEISMLFFQQNIFFDFKSFSFHHLGLSNLVRNRSTCWWWSGFLFLDSCRDRFHFVVPNTEKKERKKYIFRNNEGNRTKTKKNSWPINNFYQAAKIMFFFEEKKTASSHHPSIYRWSHLVNSDD